MASRITHQANEREALLHPESRNDRRQHQLQDQFGRPRYGPQPSAPPPARGRQHAPGPCVYGATTSLNDSVDSESDGDHLHRAQVQHVHRLIRPRTTTTAAANETSHSTAGGVGIVKSSAWANCWNCALLFTPHVILAAFALLCLPFGVASIVLIGMAYIQRTVDLTSAHRLLNTSLFVSSAGILFGLVIVIIATGHGCQPSIADRPSDLVPSLGSYSFQLEMATCDCNYGRYFTGTCYYDARYNASTTGRLGAYTACNGDIGADLGPDEKFCYYSSPAVCPFANNFHNGTCFRYVFPCQPMCVTERPQSCVCVQLGCTHGFRRAGTCYYKHRKPTEGYIWKCSNSEDMDDGYCYFNG